MNRVNRDRDECIIMGDFNVPLSKELDAPNRVTNIPNEITDKIKAWLESRQLTDIYRVQNPEGKDHSYATLGENTRTRSRIDYVFGSVETSALFTDTRYKELGLSDHKALVVKNPKDTKKGKGLWKVNEQDFDDPNTHATIERIVRETSNEDPRQTWEAIKYQIGQAFRRIANARSMREREEKEKY